MNGAHLSEEELQQYILDRPACTPEDIAHLDGCPDCQAQAAAYSQLMEGLRQQSAPVFGFDVSAMVLSQLAPERKTERRVNRRTHWGMAALILVITGVPAWLFRKSAYYVFSDISAVFLYLILAAAGVFVGLRVLHLVRRYQQIINIINK